MKANVQIYTYIPTYLHTYITIVYVSSYSCRLEKGPTTVVYEYNPYRYEAVNK